MAFLTKHNLGRLSQKIHINVTITLEMFVEHIYTDPEVFYMLNKREIEYLFIYKMLITDEAMFIAEYYNDVPEKIDTKTMVFNKGGKMKYHLDNDCSFLLKDYTDFRIPDEIQTLGNNVVDEYREWFKQKNYAERIKAKEIDIKFIVREFNQLFPVKYHFEPINENSKLILIEIPNSKTLEVNDTFDKAKFQAELTLLKDQWNKEFPCKITKIMSKFKHLLLSTDNEIQAKMTEVFSPNFVKNYGMEKLKKKLQVSKEITYKITKLILEYFKWNYNSESKSFDVLTLETFGLECCLSCYQRSRNIEQSQYK